jgi:hypothetical protein
MVNGLITMDSGISSFLDLFDRSVLLNQGPLMKCFLRQFNNEVQQICECKDLPYQ